MRFSSVRANRCIGAAIAVALLALAAPQPLVAAGENLEQIEERLDQDRAKADALARQSKALGEEIARLSKEIIAAAKIAQEQEEWLTGIEAELLALEREEAAKREQLADQRSQLQFTLAALQRLALQPREVLLIQPAPPIDTARSGLLLGAAVPALETRAERLNSELAELASLGRAVARQRTQQEKAAAKLAEQQAALSALIERKQAAQKATDQELAAARARADRLAKEARDLRDLMVRLEREAEAERLQAEAAEAERLKRESTAEGNGSPAAKPSTQSAHLIPPSAIRPFGEQPGSLVLPVRGRLLTRYGEASEGESSAKGITLEGRENAQVVAPYDGQVVYAGPFRLYGLILIIEHGGRYHSLLAGLERIDVAVGQWVLAGEAVGRLGAPQNGTPRLYLELRRAGQPINPLPWIARTDDKVQG